MKRRRPRPPLLAQQEPPTYVIDSCSWFHVRDLPDPEQAWATIFKLIAEERLCLPLEVVEEIRVDDEVWNHLHSHENAIRLQSEERYLLRAGIVASEHPQLARLRSKKTRADPFVIAVADIEGFTVVTDEGKRYPNRKIPTVCRKRGIKCVSLEEMLEAENNDGEA